MFKKLLPPYSSQQGVIHVALIVLLLFGIAAGVLLVQNGVNFLPKAATDPTFNTTFDCQNRDLVNIKWGPCTLSCRQVRCSTTEGQSDPRCKNAAPEQCIIKSSTNNTTDACEGAGGDACVKSASEGRLDGTVCGPIKGQTGNGVVSEVFPKVFFDDCNGGSLSCKNYKTSAGANIASCRSVPAGLTVANDYCTLQGIRDPGSDTDIVIKKNQIWEGRDTQGNRVRYLCKGQNDLSVEILERATGAPQGAPVNQAKQAECKRQSDFVQAQNESCNSGYTLYYCTSGGGFRCYKDGVDPSVAQPASQPTAAVDCKGNEIYKDQDNSNNGLKCPNTNTKCVIDGLKTRWCVNKNLKEGDKCEATNCPKFSGTPQECFIIGGIPRCRYPDSADNKDGKSGCQGADLTACFSGEECWIYNDTSKGTYKYSACRKAQGASAPAPAAGGPPSAPASRPASDPRAPAQPASQGGTKRPAQVMTSSVTPTSNCSEKDRTHCETNASSHGVSQGKCYQIGSYAKCEYKNDPGQKCNTADNNACPASTGGCVLDTIKIKDGSQEREIKYSRCADAPPIGGAGNQAASAPGSGPSAAAAAPPQCVGLTRDGVCVPAFQVGVFATNDQLQATQAQAKLASERYDQTVAALDKIKSQIKSEQAKQAEVAARAKLIAAQNAAKACIAQTTK